MFSTVSTESLSLQVRQSEAGAFAGNCGSVLELRSVSDPPPTSCSQLGGGARRARHEGLTRSSVGPALVVPTIRINSLNLHSDLPSVHSNACRAAWIKLFLQAILSFCGHKNSPLRCRDSQILKLWVLSQETDCEDGAVDAHLHLRSCQSQANVRLLDGNRFRNLRSISAPARNGFRQGNSECHVGSADSRHHQGNPALRHRLKYSQSAMYTLDTMVFGKASRSSEPDLNSEPCLMTSPSSP